MAAASRESVVGVQVDDHAKQMLRTGSSASRRARLSDRAAADPDPA
jgi:hypothetical protein